MFRITQAVESTGKFLVAACILTTIAAPAAAIPIQLDLSDLYLNLAEPPVYDKPVGPVPAPTARLTADSDVVRSGQPFVLRWSSTNATACKTTGGWRGARGTSGTHTVAPISQRTTFSLHCSGAGGTAVTMVAVDVISSLPLRWVPPEQNVDGSALKDLAGFRIYWGSKPGRYTEQMVVANPAKQRQLVNLSSGTYYFSMTAFDGDGNESPLSNEVMKLYP